ncbi:mitochondrial 37S ribosomal protein uS11m [Thermochaetoides thermophila DSM 1495]|uniref:Small ribosomal subunit protein uS11m n=1 Tax=Chaetomium thermophilum (strain DSM 1495 / CBS 144.50 / IMI 039719) TaxID=759272 RepID=G0SC97_CHATD|nr:hypothetical protein CTHT_0056440 [Thermochaetoides thermophila DSM 1495]EGS19023.1 hypothetical protein CTHT_0056440 [Thermochaetoides thermophila DSM 1495]
MSRFLTSRLLAVPDLARPLTKSILPAVSTLQWARLFSQSPAVRNDDSQQQQQPPFPVVSPLVHTGPSQQQAPTSTATTGGSMMSKLAKDVLGRAIRPSATSSSAEEDLMREVSAEEKEDDDSEEPYHFHIYSHKHNTHVTLTKPNRDVIMTLSCGNLGFRKSQRKHYDSAYQLGAYFIDKMHQRGLVKKINRLEVVLAGFGQGREAVVKVLMGAEGKHLRPKIVRVSDATKLKFGGTRSKKHRRLG